MGTVPTTVHVWTPPAHKGDSCQAAVRAVDAQVADASHPVGCRGQFLKAVGGWGVQDSRGSDEGFSAGDAPLGLVWAAPEPETSLQVTHRP